MVPAAAGPHSGSNMPDNFTHAALEFHEGLHTAAAPRGTCGLHTSVLSPSPSQQQQQQEVSGPGALGAASAAQRAVVAERLCGSRGGAGTAAAAMHARGTSSSPMQEAMRLRRATPGAETRTFPSLEACDEWCAKNSVRILLLDALGEGAVLVYVQD